MRTRHLAAVVLALCAAPVRAQDRPVELPPLLTPSAPQPAPQPSHQPPAVEYDHGYLYLPETAPVSPSKPPEEVRPLGRWWLNPSFEMGWVSDAPSLPTLRLRVPGVRNGPVVPLEGISADSFRLGFDVNGGMWFGERQRNGLDLGVYLLANSHRTVTSVAPGMLFFFPDGPSRSAPQIVAYPEAIAGSVTGTFPATFATWFTTADVNYRRSLLRGPNLRLDALVGYRFGYVADEVFVGDSPQENHDAFNANRFAVSNYFHGGQVGLLGEVRGGAWTVSGGAKVAFGSVTSEVSETGVFTNPEVFTGTAFVPRAGVGNGSRFAVLPTLTTTVGRLIGDDCRVFVGYSFYYLNRVARLGEVLAPAPHEERFTDFWAQAVKLGLEIRY